jgi:SPP1 family predicted phage head-tail adaptor
MQYERSNAGQLDTRIEILRAVTTTSSYNEPVAAFTSYVTVWAKRIDASMGESFRAAEVGAKITAHFVVRYSPETATVTPLDRIKVEGGLTYDIVGVRELLRNEWLEIHAVARAD